jgi:23S rRNA (guanosine2251-2'-O)-methyltransferase
MRKLLNKELARQTVEQFRKSKKVPIIVVLDNVRSQSNIGSIFRTADAFVIEAIYLCGITASPPHREIRKTALGATETVAWSYFTQTKEAVLKLKDEGYRIIGVEQAEGSVPLNKFSLDPNKKYALIFGHEINGVSQEVLDTCEGCIEIPQFGTKHSFNISISVGIVLWEVSKQLHQLG